MGDKPLLFIKSTQYKERCAFINEEGSQEIKREQEITLTTTRYERSS